MIQSFTLAELVKAKPEAAPILEKYDLDFCCKGKMKLSDQVKNEEQLKAVSAELEQLFQEKEHKFMDADAMSLSEVIDYILHSHHSYVKTSMPAIHAHLEKVAYKHGAHHPEMIKVFELFSGIRAELEHHMMKEELVLFPAIKQLEYDFKHGQKNIDIQMIAMPVRVMEAEHNSAGNALAEIRQLTNHYSIPDGACMTFALSLEELKKFEEDLHLHVHLENNTLFPRAIALFEN